MRNVARHPKPRSLVNNASRWKKELLDALEAGEKVEDKKVRDRLKRKYGKKDVKDALQEMYNTRCCYCESEITHITVDQIEHRKPISRFPGSTFEWDNLHLACPKCNGKKSDHWNNDNPILDAVLDNPISDHLSYRMHYREALTPRGTTTVDHVDLNRDRLMGRRLIIFWEAYKLIEEHNRNPRSPKSKVVRLELDRLSQGQYGSFIEYLTKTHLRDA